MDRPVDTAFREAFARWATRIRGRLTLGRVLTGATVGFLLGAAASGAAWQTRHGALRPMGAVGGLLGAVAGVAVARRRRWPDGDVALYLDGELRTAEAISTAIGLGGTAASAASSPSHGFVMARATEALVSAKPSEARPRVARPWHAAMPLAAGAIGLFSTLPLPPPPKTPPPPPGVAKVQLAELAGLEKVIKLGALDARDEAQRKRLQQLSEEAKRIREKLRAGVEKREALADIAKLKDAITGERISLGDGVERAGMEAALGKLGDDRKLEGAAKALGDRDLVRFDEEMEKVADSLEEGARERAKQELEEAAEAAKRAGAPGVAKALEEQRKRLEERGKQGDLARELAKALGSGLDADGQKALEGLDRTGNPKDLKRLSESLEKALGKLSPEERKRLAEGLKKKMESAPEEGGGKGPSKRRLRELAEDLATPEGQKRLEDALKQMAEPSPSGDAGRQKALDEAQEGAGEAEGQLGGGAPMPLPATGAGKDSPGGKSGKDSGGKDEAGAPGHTEGGGPGSHEGQTKPVEGSEVRSRAQAAINAGKPMPGMVLGRSSGRAGETANLAGTGALGQAAPGELGGVERSEVPEEYREQVGRYFQPK